MDFLPRFLPEIKGIISGKNRGGRFRNAGWAITFRAGRKMTVKPNESPGISAGWDA
jgi:hypothetical protein